MPLSVQNLIDLQRIAALSQLEGAVSKIDYTRRFLDDLAHLRCEDDCEGFRDPCAACVVHEARRRLGGQ